MVLSLKYAKGKRTAFTLSDKCEILKLVETGVLQKIAEDFDIVNSTVNDIKRSKENISSFVSSTEQGSSVRKTKKASE